MYAHYERHRSDHITDPSVRQRRPVSTITGQRESAAAAASAVATKVNPVESVRSTEPIVEMPDEHDHHPEEQQQQERTTQVEIHPAKADDSAAGNKEETSSPVNVPEEESVTTDVAVISSEEKDKQPDDEVVSSTPVNGSSERYFSKITPYIFHRIRAKCFIIFFFVC